MCYCYTAAQLIMSPYNAAFIQLSVLLSLGYRIVNMIRSLNLKQKSRLFRSSLLLMLCSIFAIGLHTAQKVSLFQTILLWKILVGLYGCRTIATSLIAQEFCSHDKSDKSDNVFLGSWTLFSEVAFPRVLRTVERATMEIGHQPVPRWKLPV